MKAKDLKNSILQMAVEGKLVSQDPNDEPANALLERIREEKHKLIAEGKAKFPKGGESIIYIGSDGSPYEKRVDAKGRVLSDKCIADEVPFELPDGWAWARLCSFFTKIGSGSTPTGGRKAYQDEGPLLIRSQNVHNDGLRLNDVAHFARSLFVKRSSHVLPKDLLLNITGASIGRCAIVPNAFGDADVNQHVLIMRPVLPITNEFLHAAVISPFMQSAIMAGQVGATKEGLSAAKAANLLVPLPPLAEQHRIVERVNDLMPLVEEYGELEDAREALDSGLPARLRKSVLQEAVQGKLVPQDPLDEPAAALLERIRGQRRLLVAEKKMKAPKGGESVIYAGSDGRRYEKRVDAKGRESEPVCIEDEIPFDIPESWEWTRLPEIASMRIGKTPSRHESGYWLNGSVPWFSISDMRDGQTVSETKEKISLRAREECFKSALVPAGTLLMSFKLTIGRTSITGVDGVHNEAIVSIAPYLDSDFYIRDYLLWALPQFASNGDTKSAIKGATLNSKTLAALLIPLPPLAEQQRIVERIQELAFLMA